MTDNLARGRIQSRDVIEELVPVRMATEAVYGHHVAPDINHQGLPLVHQRNLGMTLLQTPAQRSRGLVANEAQSITGLRCPVFEVLNNRTSGHHPTGSEDDTGTRVEEYRIPLLARIDLLEP